MSELKYLVQATSSLIQHFPQSHCWFGGRESCSHSTLPGTAFSKSIQAVDREPGGRTGQMSCLHMLVLWQNMSQEGHDRDSISFGPCLIPHLGHPPHPSHTRKLTG